MSVVPYALLYSSPSTTIGISWIDDASTGEDQQTIRYGPHAGGLTAREQTAGNRITNAEAAVYHTTLTELEPDTRYRITIEGSETVSHCFETLAATPDSVRVAVTSDHHPWREGIGMATVGRGPAVMAELGDLEFDIIVFPGDVLTEAFDGTASDAANWLRWWAEYGQAMDNGRLHPRFVIPGNHDVARDIPHTWNGRRTDYKPEDLDPNAGHFHQFFPNIQSFEPVGTNYGAVTVGDSLQLIGLDTYSAFPAVQTDWLAETIDESVDHCLPVAHTPLLPGANRGDDALNRTLREEWAATLYDASNIRFAIAGDNHCRKYTHPWRVVDSEPSHDSYFDLAGEGYLVVDHESDPNRVFEFGDGWPNARDQYLTDGDGTTVRWYLDYTELQDTAEANFHTVSLSTSGAVEVREFDQWGELLAAHAVRADSAPDT